MISKIQSNIKTPPVKGQVIHLRTDSSRFRCLFTRYVGCVATFRDRRRDHTETPHETPKERGNSGGVVLLAVVVGGSGLCSYQTCRPNCG